MIELRARTPGIVRVEFDASAPGGEHQLRVQDTQGEHPYPFTGSMHFDANIEVPRGVSQLLLKVDPAPTSEADAIVLTQPRVEARSGAASLHATTVSADPGF